MRKLAAILCVLFFPAISYATPSIGDVGGTFNHGKFIKITGTNFGQKNPAKPLVWAPFEGGKIEYDSSLSSGAGSLAYSGTDFLEISSADRPHSHSSYAVRGIPYIASPWTKRSVILGVTTSGTGKIYVFNRRKYAHSTFLDSITNLKFFRAWPETDTIYTNFVIGFVNFGTKYTSFTNEATTSTSAFTTGYSARNNAWVTEEVQLGSGDINVANASAVYWINGKRYSKTEFMGRTTTYPSLWSRWYIQNHWNIDPPPSGAYIYYDDFYSDSTWARVMIGDASTFDACTHREPLIPTAWSASSITAYFNQGSFSNLQTVYLFVVDSDGNASPGKAITIGGAAVDIPPPIVPPTPNPPINLNIQ